MNKGHAGVLGRKKTRLKRASKFSGNNNYLALIEGGKK